MRSCPETPDDWAEEAAEVDVVAPGQRAAGNRGTGEKSQIYGPPIGKPSRPLPDASPLVMAGLVPAIHEAWQPRRFLRIDIDGFARP